jgi:catechol 2,3-dioxygenase-like lactoylglutathione lyase family enzyme
MPKDSSKRPTLPKLWDVAVLVKDLEETRKRMKTLAIGQFIQPGPPEGAEGLFFQGKPLESNFRVFLMQIGNLHLEFNQPDDKPNPWSEFMNAKGEGIHHLGFQVPDVEKEVERLTALGAEAPFIGKINGKIGAAYIDLKIANLIIELTSCCSIEQDPQAKPNFPIGWDAAVLVKDLEKTKKHLERLGFGPFVKPQVPAGAEGLFYLGKPLESNLRAAGTQIGNMHLELIQPDDKPNPWSEFMNAKGEGIHHLGFQVEDVEKEVDRLTALGAEVPFIGKINGKIGAAYIDLKIANLIIELTSFGPIN